MLSVEINGMNELVRDAEKAGANAPKLVKAALTNSVNTMQRNIRQNAPHRTGTLQRSILTSVDYPTGEVKVNEKYGQYIEEGTGVYGKTGQPITPKTKKALYFKVAGKPVFAKKVKGMRARPFFKPGVEQSKSYVKAQFDKVAEILTRTLAGK